MKHIARTLYFICDLDERFVKIGISSNAPRRLKMLQAGSPLVLKLLYTHYGGDLAAEAGVHQHFARSWMHREWFELSPDIREFIRSLNGGSAVAELAAPAIDVPDIYRDDLMRRLRLEALGGNAKA